MIQADYASNSWESVLNVLKTGNFSSEMVQYHEILQRANADTVLRHINALGSGLALFPGSLQTEAYIRRLFDHLQTAPENIEPGVAVRLGRGSLLLQREAQQHFIISESALRPVTWTENDVIADQITYVLDVTDQHRAVAVQIAPDAVMRACRSIETIHPDGLEAPGYAIELDCRPIGVIAVAGSSSYDEIWDGVLAQADSPAESRLKMQQAVHDLESS